MLTTTLNRIQKVLPDDFGFRKLLGYLGKTVPDDEPVSFLAIRKGVGLSYATWCTAAEPGIDWRPLCGAFVDHAEEAIRELLPQERREDEEGSFRPVCARGNQASPRTQPGDVVGTRIAVEMWTAAALREVRGPRGDQGTLSAWHAARVKRFDAFVAES